MVRIPLGPEGKVILAPLNTAGDTVPPGPEKIYPVYNNSVLAFRWYKVDSKNYEINAYLG